MFKCPRQVKKQRNKHSQAKRGCVRSKNLGPRANKACVRDGPDGDARCLPGTMLQATATGVVALHDPWLEPDRHHEVMEWRGRQSYLGYNPLKGELRLLKRASSLMVSGRPTDASRTSQTLIRKQLVMRRFLDCRQITPHFQLAVILVGHSESTLVIGNECIPQNADT